MRSVDDVASRAASITDELRWVLDVLVVLVVLGAGNTMVASLPAGSTVRALVVVPTIVFVPGYAIVVALYPRGPDRPSSRSETTEGGPLTGGIGWTDRALLSVGLSFAVVVSIGVVLPPLGLTLADQGSLVASLDWVVVTALVVGLVRRFRLPPDARFRVRFYRPLERVSRSRPVVDHAITLLIVGLILASVLGLAVAIVAPPTAEEYTAISLLNENESGAYVAGDYPTNLTRGEEASLVVRIENHEAASVPYTVVPVLQEVDAGNGSVHVLEQRRLRTFGVTLAAGEQTYEEHRFVPRRTGEHLRLVYLLYRGDPPANPSVDSAYRLVYLWVNVSPPSPVG